MHRWSWRIMTSGTPSPPTLSRTTFNPERLIHFYHNTALCNFIRVPFFGSRFDVFFFIFETEHFRKVGRDNLGYYTCYLILDVNKCLEISRRVHETMVCHLNIWKYYDYDTCSCCTTNNITCSNLQVALFLLLLFTLFRSSVTQLFQPRFLDNNALMLSFQYKVQTSFSLIFLNCNGVFVFA